MGLKWKDLLEKLPTITSAKIDPFIQKESFIDIKVMPHITSLKYHVIPKPIVSGCSTECIRDLATKMLVFTCAAVSCAIYGNNKLLKLKLHEINLLSDTDLT